MFFDTFVAVSFYDSDKTFSCIALVIYYQGIEASVPFTTFNIQFVYSTQKMEASKLG